MKKQRKKRLLIFFATIISLIFFFYFQNNWIETTDISINTDRVPASFDGYKIVQLSDLHSKSYGENQDVIVQKVSEVNPNLIVFTGDLVDSKKYNKETSLTLMKELIQIAPVYFVTGNHEWWSGKFSSLEESLLDIGVKVMRNTADSITLGNESIQIIGIDDPALAGDGIDERSITEEAIINAMEGVGEGRFNILLSHRPELFSLYSKYSIDVVLSGHAHGGQFRMPFVGGLIAPNQGLFPKFTAGKHVSENTAMIVNRGLGNSIIPLRIFNRPEIVVLTLKTP
ncbi:putative MPP superfamily phosphohydrolase [Bacillus tianshenii]|uniref:MPP superfamily phosphohydrolase n=1 Tax=Sutcliffiella tianshenii TaxID=1463404 RepID=A0ABS2NZ79_9BACI|nr:metallophosphoesterase [Bacillus tianshenii]MBM7619678.1 putative MPP superfamily phosphohydrolase [Bacillus tianshenii]